MSVAFLLQNTAFEYTFVFPLLQSSHVSLYTQICRYMCLYTQIHRYICIHLLTSTVYFAVTYLTTVYFLIPIIISLILTEVDPAFSLVFVSSFMNSLFKCPINQLDADCRLLCISTVLNESLHAWK